jgi:pimeloyl-ACP methyl ester carboxylesterase
MAWPRQALLEDFADRVGAINVPVLVLAGSDDKVDPPQILREHLLPLITTATLTKLGGTGHLSPLEVPDRIASHISAFVTRLQLLARGSRRGRRCRRGGGTRVHAGQGTPSTCP